MSSFPSSSSSSHAHVAVSPRHMSPSSVRRGPYEDEDVRALKRQQKNEQQMKRGQVHPETADFFWPSPSTAISSSSSPSLFDGYYLNERGEFVLHEDSTVDWQPHLSRAWSVPEQAEMKRRQKWRYNVLESTLQHRRHVKNNGSGGRDGTVSIVQLLYRRSVSTGGCGSGGGGGGRKNPFGPGQDLHLDLQGKGRIKANTRTKTKTRSTTRLPNRSLNSQIQTFSEYVSTTRYHSAYLNHLGGNGHDCRKSLVDVDSEAEGEDEAEAAGSDSVENDEEEEVEEEGANVNASAANNSSNSANTPKQQKAISTISIAFSPDGKVCASSHGDHSLKVTDTATGQLLRTLDGHPRTPWTVKFHPTRSEILASGCLGHQVRLWNWKKEFNQCLSFIRLEFAIISLSFHPSGKCLAVANGTRLHFWGDLDQHVKGVRDGERNDYDYDHDDTQDTNNGGGGRSNNNNNAAAAADPRAQYGLHRNANARTGANIDNAEVPRARALLTEVEQRHMLRCVHFPPNGNTIIVGGVNPTNTATQGTRGSRGGISGGGMSFYLRLWDFDLEASTGRSSWSSSSSSSTNDGQSSSRRGGLPRRAISNPRTFVPRALLYNDGGFDVSPDGKTLCACAEYWLPEGVNNAIELLRPDENDDCVDDDDDEDDGSRDQEGERERDAMDTTSTSSRRGSMDASAHSQAQNAGSPPRPPLPHPAGLSSSTTSVSSVPPTHSGWQGGLTPQTPPANLSQQPYSLSPPSPPGRRFAGGLGQQLPPPSPANMQQQSARQASTTGQPHGHRTPPRLASGEAHHPSAAGPPAVGIPQRPTLSAPGRAAVARAADASPPMANATQPRESNPTAPAAPRPKQRDRLTAHTPDKAQSGRFVPHVVTISLDTTPYVETEELSDGQIRSKVAVPGRLGAATSTANGGSIDKALACNDTATHRPRLGQLLEACPLDGAKASAVTCVKFSPSCDFLLIGYGVREPILEHNGTPFHPVTALYRVKGGMAPVSTMLSGEDDVNIARFHPESGRGFVYGTKQGRVRVLGPRPWNYYNC